MIVALYASVLAVMFIVLTARVGRRRTVARVALGDGGDRILLRRQRAHGNFTESVPLALILLVLAEMQNGPDWALHVLGLSLIAGRALHAIAVSREPEPLPLRVAGMAMTLGAILGAALLNAWLAIA
jgi:uncharacterized membrane protein YecN with MAPEG domain